MKKEYGTVQENEVENDLIDEAYLDIMSVKDE